MVAYQLARKGRAVYLTAAVFIALQCMTTVCLGDEADAQAEALTPAASPASTVSETPPAPGESAPDSGSAPAPVAPAPTQPPAEPQPAPLQEQSPPATVTAAAPVQAGGNGLPMDPSGQMWGGFALEVHMGIAKPLIAYDEDFLDFNTIEGGLFLGGKIGKIVLGLGFEFSRVKYRESDTGDDYDYSRDGSMTSMLFKSGVRFVMAQSRDQKVDLFGQVDCGPGAMFFRDDRDYDYYDYGEDDDTYLIVGWDGGVGVRYWVHRQFAFSAMGGLKGQYSRFSDAGEQESYHLLFVFGMIQLMGVFGGR